MKNGAQLIPTLVGGLFGLALLWLVLAPETVTRGDMKDYVDVTAVEHLRLLREDLRGVSERLDRVGERLAVVESILWERTVKNGQ